MFVSIITVNYNGKKLLTNFLNSLLQLNYPRKDFEIIVVDNGSKDGSAEFIRSNFPKVKVIVSKENLGFGKGNNLGIKNSKGDFVFLVNNDTLVDKNCLTNLVKCYQENSNKLKLAAVSAKLVLYDKYLPIKVENAYFHDYIIPDRLRGVSESPYIIKMHRGRYYHEDILIPIDHITNNNLEIKITLKNPGEEKGRLYIGDKLSKNFEFINKKDLEVIDLKLENRELKREWVDLVQNAGNFVFRDGFGRDRGSLIISGKQFYEIDRNQYNKVEKIHSFCGAGVLINRKVLADTGMFDENFFMYYEDNDLSFRFKEKGWNIIFCPNALIRHIHAASSKEWSPLFIYNVERNRLLFVTKHWPRLLVVSEFTKYILLYLFGSVINHFYYGEVREGLGKFRLRVKVVLSLIPPFLNNMFRMKRLSYSEVRKLY